MDTPVTEARAAIWRSMAEHFLDTDTDREIPETARLCIASGLTIEAARDVWCHEVSPAVSFNLQLVAGEWAGWDDEWLMARIAEVRARPRGWLRRYLDRFALRYPAWRSIELCMQALLAPMIPPLPVDLPAPVLGALRAAYESPRRAYHGFDHVLEVLGHFERVRALCAERERDAIALAILFHDAVYLASRTDNETKSAELAATLLAATEHAALVPRVRQLILLTARHGAVSAEEVDRDAALFLDCDMAILGAAPEAYDAYERAIAEEYAVIPAVAYRAGRTRFLHKLLARPHIYLSGFFREEREASARENLRRSLERLSAGGS